MSFCLSFRLHPARRRFQPPPSPVVVSRHPSNSIRPTRLFTVWQLCVSGGWKPALEQSVGRLHLSSNADCFSELSQNLSFPNHFPLICFTVLVVYTVCSSGLAVLALNLLQITLM